MGRLVECEPGTTNIPGYGEGRDSFFGALARKQFTIVNHLRKYVEYQEDDPEFLQRVPDYAELQQVYRYTASNGQELTIANISLNLGEKRDGLVTVVMDKKKKVIGLEATQIAQKGMFQADQAVRVTVDTVRPGFGAALMFAHEQGLAQYAAKRGKDLDVNIGDLDFHADSRSDYAEGAVEEYSAQFAEAMDPAYWGVDSEGYIGEGRQTWKYKYDHPEDFGFVPGLKAFRREQVTRLQKAVSTAEIAHRMVMRDAEAYKALKQRFGIQEVTRRTKADVLASFLTRDFILKFEGETPMLGVAGESSSLTVADISKALVNIKDTWEDCGNQYDYVHR